MFGNTGHIHRRKLTRAEQKAAHAIAAQEHALECERLAQAIRVLQGHGDLTAAALTEAARLLRWYGFGAEADK